MDIKNDVQRNATAMRLAGASNEAINRVTAEIVEARGPIGTGKYACSCNNNGPRFIENSTDGCCPGCFQWALDHHYEVPTSELDPNRVTMEMIENNTWGIRVDKVKELKALELHNRCHEAARLVYGNEPKDRAGLNWDLLDWVPAERM
jgi:hypothetical protein